MSRWAWAEVDLDAIRHNVAVLRRHVSPSRLWAVVKADGYGHGACDVAVAALEAGADGLCVALVQEGVALRKAGIDAPILVLSEQPVATLAAARAAALTLTVCSAEAIAAVAAVGTVENPVEVHLKVDTGMHRMGARPEQVMQLATMLHADARLSWRGVYTHLACADDPSSRVTEAQLAAFEAVRGALAGEDLHPPLAHAANSAGLLAHPASRLHMVRAGIAMYGLLPGEGVAAWCDELRPAMAVRARVSAVRRVAAGEGVSYGHRHHTSCETTIATVPLGYADGVPRRLGVCGGEVLIGGRRRPIVGMVTMDQLMVDVGDDEVGVGEEVTIIGRQGHDNITADEVASRVGTIGYEIVCAVSARIARRVRSASSKSGEAGR